MNEFRGRKVQKIESPVPGCLGRMVNLFDLGTAVHGNKLLTDKPHHDGSSLSRSRSDVTRMPSPSYKGHSETELIMSDLRRSASSKVNGTPMKKLIAREMSKEVQHKQSPTNVVAKLMGLETLPQMDLETAAPQRKSRSNSHSSLNHSVSSVDTEVQKYQELSREFKDVYEMWQSPQKASRSRDCSPRKGRYDESITEKQMALVREKFAEAKRLVTDENLRQSQEFQDALEVLSSNKDLFVKYVQESNSFSQYLSGFQPVPPHPEAKRITVLRPSKAVETEKFVVQGRKNKQAKKFASSSQESGWGNRDLGYSSSTVNRRTEEHPVQPTRIVVLKPSLGKSLDIKAVSSSTSSPRGLHNGGYFDEPGDVETKEVAREITRQVRENLMGHHRNETQSSSVLSNGYISDDSSFNKSDNEDPVGNFSDSEIMSPASRHSWDCPNRFESPFSPSSFSRASFSPESSVCREAKKRLSERWALMSVTRGTQPRKHIPRTSSTLGEMLALSETKVTTGSYEESSEVAPATRVSTSCITSDMNQVEMASDSLNILARSKSVPEVRLNGETSVLGTSRGQAPRELTETASLKSSWKVSNLFFFKNKKTSKEKRDASQCSSMSQLPMPSSVSLPGKTNEDCLIPRDCIPPDASPQQSIIPGEEELTTPKPLAAGNTSENQDQPSPNSVLFPPFEEEGVGIPECSGSTTTQGEEMSLKSNLIDKSPPIGSIARILSWDDDSSTDISKPATEVHEDEDWYLFIETLLIAAGFSRGSTVSHDSLMSRWHLPNSPLDRSLRDKYTNEDNNVKEFIHEGKRRQHRSTCKLIFDCINAIISESTITHMGNDSLRFDLVEHVWAQIKDWVSDEHSKRDSGEDMDANSLAAESLVKDEILGRKWTDGLQVEIDDFGIEIESRLLQELVEEAVIDFTR
ncbi:unnamed protein product [Arabis nemorensis]|uniref:DUF4378 domain-containing protein n=1 Tax=Arabis nemorensis TaxID=586526 RepID=A0A565CC02_9BRAS|nr:unnamed protein product [Arabis nemorensis]